MKIEYSQDWQTKARGNNDDEYQIYLSCADDGTGHEIMTGEPLKTYDEWLNSQTSDSHSAQCSLGVFFCLKIRVENPLAENQWIWNQWVLKIQIFTINGDQNG